MRLQPTFDRPSRKDLVRELRATREASTAHLRALAALILEANGELRVPLSTFAILDDEMVVKQEIDTEKREVVFKLMVPDAKTEDAN